MAERRSRSRTSRTELAADVRRGVGLPERSRGLEDLPDDSAWESQLPPEVWRWQQRRIEEGAVLTCESGHRLAGDSFPAETPLGLQRWCWWPDGLPPRPWSSVVSSRLAGAMDRHETWLAAFRAACREIEQRRDVLVTAAKTTGQRLLEHAAQRLSVPVLRVQLPRPRETVTSWWRRLPKREAEASIAGTRAAILSPPWQSASVLSIDDELETYPLADRTVLDWSDTLFVLHVRRGGNLQALLPRRLHERSRHGRMLLAVGPELVPVELAEPLLQLGAERWEWQPAERVLRPAENLRAVSGTGLAAGIDIRSSRDLPAASAMPLTDPATAVPRNGPYLTHCTHAPRGRWPDQSEAEYLDELWEGKSFDKRTCLGALQRIVHQRRITASSAALRGGVRAVCFTARPLNELPQLRAFQPHRQCWRFEPYGLCLRREWLLDRGARAVIYGDATLWKTLSAADRPYFQRAATRRGDDWTVEQEWRQLGDVDLAEATCSDLFLFVPTEQEAHELAAVAPWPVVVVPERG